MTTSNHFSTVTYSINGFTYARTCRKCNLIQTLVMLDEKIALFNDVGYVSNEIMSVELSNVIHINE